MKNNSIQIYFFTLKPMAQNLNSIEVLFVLISSARNNNYEM